MEESEQHLLDDNYTYRSLINRLTAVADRLRKKGDIPSNIQHYISSCSDHQGEINHHIESSRRLFSPFFHFCSARRHYHRLCRHRHRMTRHCARTYQIFAQEEEEEEEDESRELTKRLSTAAKTDPLTSVRTITFALSFSCSSFLFSSSRSRSAVSSSSMYMLRAIVSFSSFFSLYAPHSNREWNEPFFINFSSTPTTRSSSIYLHACFKSALKLKFIKLSCPSFTGETTRKCTAIHHSSPYYM